MITLILFCRNIINTDSCACIGGSLTAIVVPYTPILTFILYKISEKSDNKKSGAQWIRGWDMVVLRLYSTLYSQIFPILPR